MRGTMLGRATSFGVRAGVTCVALAASVGACAPPPPPKRPPVEMTAVNSGSNPDVDRTSPGPALPTSDVTERESSGATAGGGAEGCTKDKRPAMSRFGSSVCAKGTRSRETVATELKAFEKLLASTSPKAADHAALVFRTAKSSAEMECALAAECGSVQEARARTQELCKKLKASHPKYPRQCP